MYCFARKKGFESLIQFQISQALRNNRKAFKKRFILNGSEAKKSFHLITSNACKINASPSTPSLAASQRCSSIFLKKGKSTQSHELKWKYLFLHLIGFIGSLKCEHSHPSISCLRSLNINAHFLYVARNTTLSWRFHSAIHNSKIQFALLSTREEKLRVKIEFSL